MNESGIVIVNAGASTATDDGSISLTMGAMGSVSIVQPTPTAAYTTLPASSGHGIYIRPSTPAAASSLTVDLKSRVSIGTQAAPMLHDGVHTRIASTTHTGSHTVTSGARIFATGDGIELAHDGAGKVTLINSGDILSTAGNGVLIRTATGNTADVRIDMTGGQVTSTARPPEKGAVRADLNGTGDAVATVSEGAALVSQYGPGLHVALGSTAATGRIRVTQGGTISARRGVVAHVARESAAGETRAADDQPAIDVAWTGTFAREEGKTEPNDAGRFSVAALDRAAVVIHRGAVGERVTRYGQAAGIEAQVMRLDALLAAVAKGDDPNALMSREAQQALLAVAVPGEAAPDDMDRARAAVIVRQFRALLTDTDFAQIPGASGIDSDGNGSYSDQEIVTNLTANNAERRTFLRNLLLDGLSEGEEAIVTALTTGGDLEAALAALPDYGSAYAAYDDSWEAEVRAFLNWHNVGNIRLAVNAGAIDSRGDGIRAGYVIPHDDNGSIDVTVAEGARVTGAMAGIYVANAGCPVDDGCVPGEAGIRDQTVTVHGLVMGGTDAAVHLSGGGSLNVGRTGQLLAGSSGQAILVNDPGPADVRIDGLVRGGTGARAAVDLTGGGSVTIGVNGRVEANGAMSAIRGDEDTSVTLYAARLPREIQDWLSRESADEAAKRVEGDIVGAGTTTTTFKEFQDGVTTGHEATVPLKDGRPDTSGLREAVYPEDPGGSGRAGRRRHGWLRPWRQRPGTPRYRATPSAARADIRLRRCDGRALSALRGAAVDPSGDERDAPHLGRAFDGGARRQGHLGAHRRRRRRVEGRILDHSPGPCLRPAAVRHARRGRDPDRGRRMARRVGPWSARQGDAGRGGMRRSCRASEWAPTPRRWQAVSTWTCKRRRRGMTWTSRRRYMARWRAACRG